ncbi:hypothetical protein HDU98_007766, partial [Podochytrium sp. JEL0797]
FLGLPLSNPVGLAAGFNKHANGITDFFTSGFGLVEIGSVTPLPQPGNPLPRIFRLEEDSAIVNRCGFNSEGHAVILGLLEARGPEGDDKGVDAESRIGGQRGKEYDFESGGSCPNTPGLRGLQRREPMLKLLNEVMVLFVGFSN